MTTGTRHNEYARLLRIPFYVFGRPSWGLWPAWVHRLVYAAAKRLSLRADRRRRDVDRCSRVAFGRRHYFVGGSVVCDCTRATRYGYAAEGRRPV